MSCEKVKGLLEDYLAGLLTLQQVRAIEEHLATCPSCQTLFLADDAELEAVLATDWYAAEPPVDFVPQVMGMLPTRRGNTWAKVAVVVLAWSCYFAFWLVGAAALGYAKVYQRLCSLALKARIGLHFLLSIVRSLGNVLSLLMPTPLAISLLLVLLATLSYCLYRLEKEENII